jgi:hypothetical protein
MIISFRGKATRLVWDGRYSPRLLLRFKARRFESCGY